MLATFSLPPENVAEVMFEVGEEQNLVGQTAKFTLDQGTLITSAMVGVAGNRTLGSDMGSSDPCWSGCRNNSNQSCFLGWIWNK